MKQLVIVGLFITVFSSCAKTVLLSPEEAAVLCNTVFNSAQEKASEQPFITEKGDAIVVSE